MSKKKQRGVKFLNHTRDGFQAKSTILGNPHNAVMVTVVDKNAGASATTDPVLVENLTTSRGYQNWGSNNLWPQEVREKVEKNTTAYPIMVKLVCMVFGIGLRYYQLKYDENGKETMDFTPIPDIENFLDANNVEYLLLEGMMDYKFFGNTWCEFILSTDLSKIVNINHLEAEFTRFEQQQEDGRILNIGYCGNWKDSAKVTPIPLLDKRNFDKEKLMQRFAKDKKFAMHSCFPSPGRKTYAVPPHIGLYRENGWLDYSNSVPEIMNNINKNAMNIKYHIEIPLDYFESKHEGWNELSEDEKTKIEQDELTAFDNWISGSKNIKKSLITYYQVDDQGKAIGGWKITEMDDKTKYDQYLTSTQESDTQITRALGADSSQAVLQPQGGKMGAGSGSDKRVGADNTIAASHAEQQIHFEKLKLVGLWNGWPKVKWIFAHQQATTLDVNPTGTTKTV